MARYTNTILTGKNVDEINKIVEECMKSAKFKYVNFKGEQVWKKGGALTAPQFLKVTPNDGGATVEAWLKFSWVPGVYSGEMDLTGAMGFAIKEMLKKRVNEMESKLSS